MKQIDRTIRRVDRFQQRRPWVAFPLAVVKKFGDDRAGNLAALIAYYGFFSLFPLLLVFVSVLGLVLRGNQHLLISIQRSALGQFPVIGDQIRVHGLAASGMGLAVGIVTALWGGLGVTQAAQTAMNEVWDVPKKDRPNFLVARARGLIMLVVLGTFVLLSTFMSGLGASSGRPGAALRVLGVAGSLLANLALYMIAFRVLTRKNLGWADVFPGAAVGATVWTILQLVGNYYVSHQIKNASPIYGTFALVIGLLVWIYLGAQVTLYAAEINVVRKDGLWPRGLTEPPLTDAGREVMEREAKAEARLKEEDIHVGFDPEAEGSSSLSTAGREEDGGDQEEPSTPWTAPGHDATEPATPKGDGRKRGRRPFASGLALGGLGAALAGVILARRRARRR